MKIKTKSEKREIKKRKKMKISGKSVFKIKEILDKKSQNDECQSMKEVGKNKK